MPTGGVGTLLTGSSLASETISTNAAPAPLRVRQRAGLVAAPVWCFAPLITSPPVFARPNAMAPRVAIAELFSLAQGEAADVLAIS